MTRVYFVRHAQPEHDWEEDRTRPLTEEGRKILWCHILSNWTLKAAVTKWNLNVRFTVLS